MLIWLVELADHFQFFNLFRYITFRTGAALFTSAIIVFLFGPRMISSLRVRQGKGQPIRADGPQTHFKKAGTPTMGGLMILAGIVCSSLLWADLSSVYVVSTLLVTLGFGAIGFYDDYLKETKQSDKGFSGKARLGIEFVIAAIAVFFMMRTALSAGTSGSTFGSSLTFPFLKDFTLNLGYIFILFCGIVIVGAGNAVFANYLQIHFVPGTGELAVILGAVIGAGLGFLWFNAPPAAIFMGDTGSLALGGLIGTVAVATKHEIVMIIIGGLFVIETLSVIIQVFWFKRTGKRVFLMAPIHHHFEKKGWTESQVVIRFWIIAVILAMVGLATLKLR